MTEPSQFVIAYWLLPAEPARAYFHEMIERLAAKYDGPAFEPHLTLAVGPDRRDKAERTLAGLTTDRTSRNRPRLLPQVYPDVLRSLRT